MQHVLELEERYGITGHCSEEPTIGAGDLARTEHIIHELSHAVLLFEGFEQNLSAAISSKLDGLEDEMATYPMHENELETFAVESLVADTMHLPIHPVDFESALAVQVANVLPDDFVARYREVKGTERIKLAADRVCSLVAPDGPEPQPEPGAVFWRKVESGDQLVVYPMLLGNARLCIFQDDSLGTMLDAWCYQTDMGDPGLRKAIWGASEWNGEGDDPPGGWYRNPLTGRRRPGGDHKQEFKAW